MNLCLLNEDTFVFLSSDFSGELRQCHRRQRRVVLRYGLSKSSIASENVPRAPLLKTSVVWC